MKRNERSFGFESPKQNKNKDSYRMPRNRRQRLNLYLFEFGAGIIVFKEASIPELTPNFKNPVDKIEAEICLLYTSPSPRDRS